MAKVLVISSVLVVPPHSGSKARILGVARALRQIGHEVHFAFVATSAHEPREWNLHEIEFGRGNAHLLFAGGPASKVWNRLRQSAIHFYRSALNRTGLPRRHYSLLDERVPVGLGSMLRALQDSHRFDSVVVEYVWLSKLLNEFPDTVRKVIDTHDIFSDRHVRMKRNGHPYTFYTIPPEAERRGLQRADVVLAIEEEEQRYFSEMLRPDTKVYTVSHFIEEAEPIAAVTSHAGIFLGSDSHGNQDAIGYFLDAILPRILKQCPDFTLFVAGDICKHVPARANVVPVGRVENLRELFERSPLLINPARVGTGIAIKLLDALACGVPVVTTRTGARGHGGAAGGLVIVPDEDGAAFADAVLMLLNDQKRREQLGAEAAEYAKMWNAKQRAILAEAIPIES